MFPCGRKKKHNSTYKKNDDKSQNDIFCKKALQANVRTYIFVVELDHNFLKVGLEVVVVPLIVRRVRTRCRRKLKQQILQKK